MTHNSVMICVVENMMQDHRNIVPALQSNRDYSEIESIVAVHVETATHGIIAHSEALEGIEPKIIKISIGTIVVSAKSINHRIHK